jgi:hypothetical protein
MEGDNYVNVSLSGTGNRNARIRTINLVTKTLVSDRSVTFSENVSTWPVAFFKNNFYLRRSLTEMTLFDANGQFVRVITSNFSATNTIRRHCCIGEHLIGGMTTNNFFISDGINIQAYTNAASSDTADSVLAPSASFKAPLFINGNGNTGMLTPYMATINNLQSPVVKNNLNTMKITYELTQA